MRVLAPVAVPSLEAVVADGAVADDGVQTVDDAVQDVVYAPEAAVDAADADADDDAVII